MDLLLLVAGHIPTQIAAFIHPNIIIKRNIQTKICLHRDMLHSMDSYTCRDLAPIIYTTILPIIKNALLQPP